MDTSRNATREYGIDLLRIVAMIMIPIMHLVGHGGVINAAIPFSVHYESAWLLVSFCLVAVNCFVLITGYVYYEKEPAYYRLLTLWAEVLFYSLIITGIIKLIYPDEITLQHFFKSAIPTFYMSNLFSRYWFFSAYLGMFLFSPFVNVGLKHFNKKQDLTVFLSMFIAFSLLPTILMQDNAFWLNQGYSTLWFVFVYYTGGLIHKYDLFSKFKISLWLLIHVVCILFSWAINYIFEANGWISTGFSLFSYNCYLSPFIFIGAIALFYVFKSINISIPTLKSIISFFTPVCFGVYLIHDHMTFSYYFIRDKFVFLLNTNAALTIIGSILCGIAIFIVCSLIDWMRELLFRKLKIEERFKKLFVR